MKRVIERSRCYAGGSAELDEQGGLLRTLWFYGKILAHQFIDVRLVSPSIDRIDHDSGSSPRQFHDYNETHWH